MQMTGGSVQKILGTFKQLSLMSAFDELEGEADVRAQPLKHGSLDLLSHCFTSRLISFRQTRRTKNAHTPAPTVSSIFTTVTFGKFAPSYSRGSLRFSEGF